MNRPTLGIPRTAIYPPLVAVAYVVSEYASLHPPLEALPRPLFVAFVFALTLQVALSVVLMNIDRGAFLGLVVLFFLIGLPVVSLILAAWLAIAAYVSVKRGRGLRAMPWLRATRILNGVSALALVLVVVNAFLGGAIVPAGTVDKVARGGSSLGQPDIYLIMLDAYPRADTLATEYAFDNSPFLTAMEGMGFDVAENSHSNYDSTVLTLASMFNATQIPTLIPAPPAELSRQFRTVARAINGGSQLDLLRADGYEIVSIPSGYPEGALLSADRVLDSGQLSTFEVQLLSRGGIPLAIGGIERSWLPDEHRARVRSTFAALDGLASERTGTPKFVFAHILSPHMPIAFTKDGAATEQMACFPVSCSMYSYLDEYGSARVGPVRDQIAWLNGQVEQTVRAIQAQSATPPIIVVFSDHGLRLNETSRDEAYRSVFMAATPGKADVFPESMTPVNLLPRLLNAYTGSTIPLSSEEWYWLDTRTTVNTDLLGQLEVQPNLGD